MGGQVIFPKDVFVRRDLIYEGITTGLANRPVPDYLLVRRDLIYEGITTVACMTIYLVHCNKSEGT